MFLNTRKNFLIAAGVLLAAGAGAAAWIQESENRPAAVSSTAPGADIQPVVPAVTTANYSVAPPAAAASYDGYYPSIQPPVTINQPQAPPEQPVAAPYQEGQYAGGDRENYYRYRSSRRHGRSKKHSIEIVAGTAAAGAAIGAIAGGGSGAAIGAISGAGAGFTYDRLTHH